MTNTTIKPYPSGITITDLEKTFSHHNILKQISVNFAPGKIHGLFGNNGCGKTTLMSLICNHLFPTAGTVTIDGQNPAENTSILAKTCFIHENQRWHDYYTAENILNSAKKFYPRWNAVLADILIEKFHLPLDIRMKKASRGQRSALASTISLASHAEYTFLDEVYLGLDPASRDIFYTELIKTQSTDPRTFIMSTHLIDECANLFDTVTIINNGKIKLSTDTETVLQNVWKISCFQDTFLDFLKDFTILSTDGEKSIHSAIVQIDDSSDLTRMQNQGTDIRPATLQELVIAVGA